MCTQKLSLSLLVTTVWTLWESNCGPLSSMWGQTRCHRLPSLNHGDLGRGWHEQICVSPFIFNSKVGTTVCHSCGYVTTNIWGMRGNWVGVGQASILKICPHPPPLIFPKPPQSLSAPKSPHTLQISWTYIEDILGVYWPYLCLIYWGLSHFLNTFNTVTVTVTTSSPHLHNNS